MTFLILYLIIFRIRFFTYLFGNHCIYWKYLSIHTNGKNNITGSTIHSVVFFPLCFWPMDGVSIQFMTSNFQLWFLLPQAEPWPVAASINLSCLIFLEVKTQIDYQNSRPNIPLLISNTDQVGFDNPHTTNQHNSVDRCTLK